jgi:hypothetical protein
MNKDQVLNALDHALDRWMECHDERANELQNAIEAVENGNMTHASYLVRSFSLDTNGCCSCELQDWAANFKA